MKVRLIICAAAALLFCFSCDKEKQEEPQPVPDEKEEIPEPAKDKTLTFSATFADAISTKTALLSDGATIYWKGKESISVFRGNNFIGKFTSTNNSPGTRVFFTGTVHADADATDDAYLALYPFSEENGYDGSDAVIPLSATQTAGRLFADMVFPAVAKSISTDLKFYCLCGGVRFFVTQKGVTQLVFKSINGSPLAGKMKVSFASDGRPAVTGVPEGESSITVNAPEGGFVPGDYYYAFMIPGTHPEGLTVQYSCGQDSSPATKEIGQPITIQRAEFQTIGIVDYGPEQSRIIGFKDSEVKKIAVSKFDIDHDGELSLGEAAAVEDLGLAFYGNSSIKSFEELQYFTGLSKLGEYAFYECRALESIVLPPQVTRIEKRAFELCEALESITLPAGLTSIGTRAFFSCSGLFSISLPDSVSSIEEGAFCHCKKLASFEIPKSLTRIESRVLYGCSGLTSMNIPEWITSIGESAFDCCLSSRIFDRYRSRGVRCLQKPENNGNPRRCNCHKSLIVP